jgi:hypothetical protein
MLLLLPGLLAAQQPLEAPFGVDVGRTPTASPPVVATSRSGEFLVVWGVPDAPPSVRGRIYARKFGADGLPVTDQLVVAQGVSPFWPGYQAALQDDGSFAVAYTGWAGEAARLRLRWFTSDGTLEDEADVAAGAGYLSMTALADHGIVLSWSGATGLGGPVYARSYGPDHQEQSPRIEVDPNGLYGEVAAAPGGSFVVAWHNTNGAPNFTTAAARVSYRRFEADGSPAGNIVNVTENVRYDGFDVVLFRSFVGVDAAGNVLVAWSRLDTTDRAPRIRWYSPGDQPLNRRAIRLPWGESLPQSFDLGELGNFLLSWQRSVGSNFKTMARRYDRNGQPLGSVVEVSRSASSEGFSDIGILPGGRFVVAWLDRKLGGYCGILARRFRSR